MPNAQCQFQNILVGAEIEKISGDKSSSHCKAKWIGDGSVVDRICLSESRKGLADLNAFWSSGQKLCSNPLSSGFSQLFAYVTNLSESWAYTSIARARHICNGFDKPESTVACKYWNDFPMGILLTGVQNESPKAVPSTNLNTNKKSISIDHFSSSCLL